MHREPKSRLSDHSPPAVPILTPRGHWQRVDHTTGWELSVYIRTNTSEALSSYFSLTSGQVFYSFKVYYSNDVITHEMVHKARIPEVNFATILLLESYYYL